VSLIEAIVLGIVQGLTEFLPISSTGHLRIVPALLGWDDPGAAFTAVTQLGTVLAVLVFFRRDLWTVARAWLASLREPSRRGSLDARMGWYLIVGTIPISIFGLAFEGPIENGARSLYLVGVVLVVFAFVMLAADRFSSRDRGQEDVTLRDGLVVGCAQALALVPGVSRAGATITAGLFLGLNRTAAARFSFLLSVPAVVLSGVFQLEAMLAGEEGGVGLTATAVATLVAFAFGYASIAFLLRFLERHGLGVFVGYRIVLGVTVLALVATGAIA